MPAARGIGDSRRSAAIFRKGVTMQTQGTDTVKKLQQTQTTQAQKLSPGVAQRLLAQTLRGKNQPTK